MERVGDPQCYSERFETTGEAALLHAAGFTRGALAMLCRECDRHGAAAGPKAWTMLFEACHLLGERAEFDRLCAAYHERFGASAPPWGYAPAIAVPGMARLEGVLASMRDVRPLVEAAKSRRTIAVDFSRVERIDFGFAPALCALLRGWGMQGRRVILANIAELHAELLQCVGLGAHVALLRRRLLEGEVADASGASNDDSVASAPILAAA